MTSLPWPRHISERPFLHPFLLGTRLVSDRSPVICFDVFREIWTIFPSHETMLRTASAPRKYRELVPSIDVLPFVHLSESRFFDKPPPLRGKISTWF